MPIDTFLILGSAHSGRRALCADICENALAPIKAAVFVSVMLPLRLKFEGEKGRVVLPLVIAAAGILIYGGVKLADLADIDLMKAAVDVMNRIGAAGIIGMLIAVPAVVAVISWLCSWHILRKKEF